MRAYCLSTREKCCDAFAVAPLFRKLLTCSLLVLLLTAVFSATSFAAEPAPNALANTAVSQDEEAEVETEASEATEGESENDEDKYEPKKQHDPFFLINNLWIMLAGMLVFIMHLGFATLESGLTRSKNTVNILFKNTMIVCIGLISYGVIGFNLMYPSFVYEKPDDWSEDKEFVADLGFFKVADEGFGFLLNGPEIAAVDDEPELKKDATAEETAEHEAALATYKTDNKTEIKQYNANSTSTYNDFTKYADFFFQAMFAATCCTIVSGAVAGRIKLGTFLIFCTLFVTISYPITGSWQWGSGWLAEAGFVDFAGSTLVHSVGGWGALVMAVLLGARKGKYVDGKPRALAPSSMPLAAIGVFLLWFGWFGFNGGSVLNADPGKVSLVLVTTSMAAAAGGLAAALVSTFHGGKPDLSMALNGILAGLVGITAGADLMSGLDAIIIGAIAGVLVYFAVIFIDSVLKIDDPVGAISVHLVCGIWGTLAVGIFGASAGGDQILAQLKGIGAIGLFTVVFCLIVGLALKFTLGLRVSEQEESEGLDLGEHGIQAYAIH